jgi:hypothetical protein
MIGFICRHIRPFNLISATLIHLVWCSNIISQTYTVYSTGPNYVGGSYVAPVTTTTYTFSSNTYSSGSGNTGYSGYSGYSPPSYYSGYGSSTSSVSSASSGSWRGHKTSRRYRKMREKVAIYNANQKLKEDEYVAKCIKINNAYFSGNIEDADSLLNSLPAFAPSYTLDTFANNANYQRLILNMYFDNYESLIQNYFQGFGQVTLDQNYTVAKTLAFGDDPGNTVILSKRSNLSLLKQLEVEAAYTIAVCRVKGKKEGLDYWNKVFPVLYPKIMSTYARNNSPEKEEAFDILGNVFNECGRPDKGLPYFSKIIKHSNNKEEAREKICRILLDNDCSGWEGDKEVRNFLKMHLDTLENAFNNQPERLQNIYFMKAQLSLLENDFNSTLGFSSKLNYNDSYKLLGVYFKAKALIGIGHDAEAIQVISGLDSSKYSVYKPFRNYVLERSTLADAFYSDKLYDLAITYYDLAANDPGATETDKVYCLVKKGLVMLTQGKVSDAISTLQKTVADYNETPYPLMALADAYLSQNKKSEAAPYLKRAKALGYPLTAEQLTLISR